VRTRSWRLSTARIDQATLPEQAVPRSTAAAPSRALVLEAYACVAAALPPRAVSGERKLVRAVALLCLLSCANRQEGGGAMQSA